MMDQMENPYTSQPKGIPKNAFLHSGEQKNDVVKDYDLRQDYVDEKIREKVIPGNNFQMAKMPQMA